MARGLYAVEGIREAALELCVEVQKVSVTGGGREVVVGQHEGSGEAWGNVWVTALACCDQSTEPIKGGVREAEKGTELPNSEGWASRRECRP